MQYLLMLYAAESEAAQRTPDEMQARIAAYGAYTRALDEAGVLVGRDRLQPVASATTVRVADGKTEVLHGPYADTREQLGGYYLIDVADLDVAISWATRCPGASHGSVEVRPVWKM